MLHISNYPILTYIKYLKYNISLMRKTKEADDAEYDRTRAQSLMPDYTKSFQIGATKKFVNISLPDVELKGK